jgi:hypothetical protein
MPRAPARFTQADMARAIKAMVQACGGASVEIARDGTIRILPGASSAQITSVDQGDNEPASVEPVEEIVL